MRRLSVLALLALGLPPGVGRAPAQSPAGAWIDYLGGPDSSHYSPLKQIHRGNVANLEVAWTYQTGDNVAYAYNPLVVDNLAYVLAKNGAIVALDGVSGKELWVHEFERSAGGGRGGGGASGSRGLNYWESDDRSDRRLLIAVGNFLQAIDARTGKRIESFGVNGRVDLKQGLSRDAKTVRNIQSRTPGRVFEDLLLLGSAPGEAYMSAPGDLRAFDVRTGKQMWTFHTVPHPGEFGYDTWPKDAWKYAGGTNTWGEISVDEKRGIAYFPLGSPTYDFYGADRKGANLFGNCLLALDARTGKYKWHFQLVHHDLWDYDAAAAPQLITVKQNGKTIDAVAQATKQGFLFVFDRVTGKPLWPVEERAVPKSGVPGEQAWPTQPFPTAPPPYARQKFTVEDVDPYYLTPEERAKFKDRLLSARNEGLFTPAGFTETVQMPGNNGGSIFFTSAAEPASGTVYVIAKNVPSLIKLVDNPRATAPAGAVPAAPVGPARMGRALYDQNCSLCHGADLKGNGTASRLDEIVAKYGQERTREIIRRGQGKMPSFSNMPEASMTALLVFLAEPGAAPPGSAASLAAPAFTETPYPAGVDAPTVRYYTGYGYETSAIGPPWSTLTAFDLNKGTIKWQAPFGDNPQAGPAIDNQMRGNMWPKSGIAVTAGGLIFFASNEGKLRAMDKDTGKYLWSYDLPHGSQGVPAVYQAGGRQFLLVTVTGAGGNVRLAPNGKEPPGGPRMYMAFALK